VLHRDAAAQRGDAVDVAVADRLGMVEEPVDAGQRDIAVDLLVHVERAADGLVIGGVQAPGPAVFGQQADHRFQIAFHARRHVGRATRKSSKSAAE
jgi:hypothetical protein